MIELKSCQNSCKIPVLRCLCSKDIDLSFFSLSFFCIGLMLYWYCCSNTFYWNLLVSYYQIRWCLSLTVTIYPHLILETVHIFSIDDIQKNRRALVLGALVKLFACQFLSKSFYFDNSFDFFTQKYSLSVVLNESSFSGFTLALSNTAISHDSKQNHPVHRTVFLFVYIDGLQAFLLFNF